MVVGAHREAIQLELNPCLPKLQSTEQTLPEVYNRCPLEVCSLHATQRINSAGVIDGSPATYLLLFILGRPQGGDWQRLLAPNSLCAWRFLQRAPAAWFLAWYLVGKWLSRCENCTILPQTFRKTSQDLDLQSTKPCLHAQDVLEVILMCFERTFYKKKTLTPQSTVGVTV